MADHEVHLTSRETAERLKITPDALRMWRARGKGPAYLRDGRWVRYRVADVEAWEQARSQQAAA